MNYLTITTTEFERLSPTETEVFLSDSDGTANNAGLYTTQYVGYANPRTASMNSCVIKRIITESSTGDLTVYFAYKAGESNSLTFNKGWTERASLTYQPFKL